MHIGQQHRTTLIYFLLQHSIDFSINSSGIDTLLSYLTPKSKTHSDITVSSFYLQDQVDLRNAGNLL